MVLRRLRGGLGSFVGVARFGLEVRGVLVRLGEPEAIARGLGRPLIITPNLISIL